MKYAPHRQAPLVWVLVLLTVACSLWAFPSAARAGVGASAKVSGVVVNDAGSPIAGATVATASTSAATDASGTYLLRVVPGTYILTASAPGYQSVSKSTYARPGAVAWVDFTLTADAPKTGTIEGSVTDASTGLALANAYVLAQNSTTGATFAVASEWDGDYRLDLPPGVYDLTFRVPLYLEHVVSGIEVSAGDTKVVDVALQPAPTGAIAGRVYDASTGAGISGATVQGCEGGDLRALTDSAGYYVLPDLPPSLYRLTASAPGYVPRSILNISVVANQVTTADFALTPAP